MSTRRRFLSVSAAVLTTAALPKRLFAEQTRVQVFTNASAGAYTQGLLTEANFAKQIGSVFNAFFPGGEVARLTLMSVKSYAPAATSAIGRNEVLAKPPLRQTLLKTATPASTSFALSFNIDGPLLAQGSYLLDHGILGSFAAFLVPGDQTSGIQSCGAVFNYLASSNGFPAQPPDPRLSPKALW